MVKKPSNPVRRGLVRLPDRTEATALFLAAVVLLGVFLGLIGVGR